MIYSTQHSSVASRNFVRKSKRCIEILLEKTGFDFLSVKQAGFLLLSFVIAGSSFTFNLGAENHAHAIDAIDAPAIEIIDNGTISAGIYLPVIPLAERSKITQYTVVAGDTITSVANQFGISPITVIAANNIVGDIIRPGDVLNILPTTGVLHEVKAKETINKIAQKYGIPSKTIQRWNNLTDDTIAKGDKLIIPGVEPEIKHVSRNVVYSEGGKYIPVARTVLSNTGNGDLFKPVGKSVYTQKFTGRHPGLDMAAPTGTEVYAAEGGVVERADFGGWNGGYGNVIVIDHGNGLNTLYGHLSAIHVQAGDVVDRGMWIGRVGSTGRSTGPHLHLEVIQGTQKLNPVNFF